MDESSALQKEEGLSVSFVKSNDGGGDFLRLCPGSHWLAERPAEGLQMQDWRGRLSQERTAEGVGETCLPCVHFGTINLHSDTEIF